MKDGVARNQTGVHLGCWYCSSNLGCYAIALAPFILRGEPGGHPWHKCLSLVSLGSMVRSQEEGRAPEQCFRLCCSHDAPPLKAA